MTEKQLYALTGRRRLTTGPAASHPRFPESPLIGRRLRQVGHRCIFVDTNCNRHRLVSAAKASGKVSARGLLSVVPNFSCSRRSISRLSLKASTQQNTWPRVRPCCAQTPGALPASPFSARENRVPTRTTSGSPVSRPKAVCNFPFLPIAVGAELAEFVLLPLQIGAGAVVEEHARRLRVLA